MRESGSALKFEGSSAEELGGDVVVNPQPIDTYLWCYATVNKS